MAQNILQVVLENIAEVVEQLNVWANSGKFFIMPLTLEEKKGKLVQKEVKWVKGVSLTGCNGWIREFRTL